MKQHLYFAYGMNTNVGGMAVRCPKAVSHGRAILLDYTFRFSGPADVVPTEGSYVDGVLWTITDECLRSLDALEGFPYYYNRKHLRVMHQGKVCKALTYFMNPGYPDDYPSQGYFNMVEEGYREHGVPVDQLYNALEASYGSNYLLEK